MLRGKAAAERGQLAVIVRYCAATWGGGVSMSEDEAVGGDFVVIGAGPAGLTAGYELVKLGLRPVVVEQQTLVGGLASTAQYRGYYFDMGGHRFFTKVEEVKKLWREVLPPVADILQRNILLLSAPAAECLEGTWAMGRPPYCLELSEIAAVSVPP